MRRTTRLLAIGPWLSFFACSSEPPVERDDSCEVGRSLSCACTDGTQGAQVCEADGTLGECVCTPGAGGSSATSGGSSASGNSGLGGGAASGGSLTNGGSVGVGGTSGTSTGGSGLGGSSASGGSIATGGSSGSSGSSGTGGIGGGNPDNWVNVTVTYDGSTTRVLSHLYSATINYTAASDSGMIIYQVEDGYTEVIVDIRPARSGGGYEVLFYVSDANTSLPARLHGAYDEVAATGVNYVPLEASCVTFGEFDMRFGGVVSGTLDCMLFGGNDTTPVPATATGSFHAVFPE